MYSLFAGSFDDGEGGADFTNVNWSEYWRALFKEITIEDIRNYEKTYKGNLGLLNYF